MKLGEVTGAFSPRVIEMHQSPFQKQMQYRGKFKIEGITLPCTVYFPKKKKRPKANQNYQISGVLSQRGPYEFTLKAHTWDAISPSWNGAELRFQTKESFKKMLSKNLSSPKVCSFLSAITTGSGADRSLRYEFGRVGLQHILAISGFHFAILIAFFELVFGFFLSQNKRIGILFILMSAYCIFIGPSASVERSYLTAFFYLLSKWLSRPTSALNLLGVAAIIELLFNPFISNSIAFILSFLSCFGILTFFPFFERRLQKILPQKKEIEIDLLSLLDKHGYLLSCFFRKLLSLNLAISAVLMPVLLFYFHQFPLLSFAYNLFVPTWVALAMILLILALVFLVLFPPVGAILFWITNGITKCLLDVIANPPLAINASIQIANIPSEFVICYLFVLGIWGITWTHKQKQVLFV